MSFNTLTIISKKGTDASQASRELTFDDALVRRVFVIYDPDATSQRPEYVARADFYLPLPRAGERRDVEEIAIRAGVLYAGGWGVLFCRAEALPSPAEVREAIADMEQEGWVRRPRVWGATREHLTLQGWSALSPSEGDQWTPGPAPARAREHMVESVGEANTDLLMVAAMQGEPVPVAVVEKLLAEQFDLSRVWSDVLPGDEISAPISSLIDALEARAESHVDTWDMQPTFTISVVRITSGPAIEQMMRDLPARTTILLITPPETNYTGKIPSPPFRTFRTTSDLRLELYRGQRTE